MTTPSEPHIVAFVGNAQDEEYEILFAIAVQNDSGEWHTDEGTRVWPYWTEPVSLPDVLPPEGWFDHLALEAQRYAAQQRDARRPSGLAALLNAKPKPTTPVPITITRRGF